MTYIPPVPPPAINGQMRVREVIHHGNYRSEREFNVHPYSVSDMQMVLAESDYRYLSVETASKAHRMLAELRTTGTLVHGWSTFTRLEVSA